MLPSGASENGPADGEPEGEVAYLDDRRLRALVDDEYDFVWRSLRRLGVPDGDVDDGVQRVFLVLSRKLGSVRPGSERSFLFQTALRVAADRRRAARRRRETPEATDFDALSDPKPSPDELLDRYRARRALDRVLDELSLELRAVFTLFELEQMTLTEIAELLGLPRGTVASRLARARREFHERAAPFLQPPGDDR